MSSWGEAVRAGDRDGVHLIVLRGEVDIASHGELAFALAGALHSPEPATVIDLSAVAFADSTLLNCLLLAVRDHRAAGRPLALAGPCGVALRRLFTVTGTTAHLPLAPDRPAALRQVTGAGLPGGTPRRER